MGAVSLLLRDVEFWEKAWRQERAASLYGYQVKERADIRWWDRRAGLYARNTGGQEGEKRAAQLLHWLGHHQTLGPATEILDIGCGPGNEALILARRARRVVALDPAPNMLTILKERAEAAGLQNIETVCSTWEEVDLAARGWEQAFDLVIASRSPGVKDVPAVRKMTRAARGGCFYSGFISRYEPERAELWRRFFGTPMPPMAGDAIYIFHLLLAWGYYPSLELEHRRGRREMQVEEAVADLEDFFYAYTELTEEVKAQICRYVGENSWDGLFVTERESVTGLLFWPAGEFPAQA